jgi:hypothetical protein
MPDGICGAEDIDAVPLVPGDLRRHFDYRARHGFVNRQSFDIGFAL